jgi:MATE family multidrug resistance protein
MTTTEDIAESPAAPAESGFREVVRLAWPLVINNSVWTAQIFIDRALLSRHSQVELAATLNSMVIFWVAMNFFFHVTGYVATFVAQYTGAARPQRIGPVVGQALYTALIGGIFLMSAAPFSDQLFAWINHEPKLQQAEAIYFFCLCFSGLPSLIASAVNGFFIGRGDSRTVLWMSFAALIVNGVLDYLWIFGNGGFPEWGIAGAGWATVAGQWVGAIIGLALFLRRRFHDEYRTRHAWRFEPALFLRLLRFAVPNGTFMMLECAAFAVFVLFISRIGTREAAASNMALTLNIVAFLPAMGIGQAIEVLVGKYQGERRPDLSAQRAYTGLAIAGTLMTIMALAYFLIPNLLLIPFRGKESHEEIALAAVLLRFVAFYCIFDAANNIFSFALRGAGDTKFVMLVVSFLPWVLMVVPIWIVSENGGGIYAIWTIASGYIASLAFVFYARFRHGAWRSMQVIEAVAVEA